MSPLPSPTTAPPISRREGGREEGRKGGRKGEREEEREGRAIESSEGKLIMGNIGHGSGGGNRIGREGSDCSQFTNRTAR